MFWKQILIKSLRSCWKTKVLDCVNRATIEEGLFSSLFSNATIVKVFRSNDFPYEWPELALRDLGLEGIFVLWSSLLQSQTEIDISVLGTSDYFASRFNTKKIILLEVDFNGICEFDEYTNGDEFREFFCGFSGFITIRTTW